jgi:hypothetical protein
MGLRLVEVILGRGEPGDWVLTCANGHEADVAEQGEGDEQ